MKLTTLMAVLLLAGTALPLTAQRLPPSQDTAALRRAAEQQFGRGVSQAEVLERIRESGMSRAQIRARLQQAGYDPSLADRYYDIMDRGGEPPLGEASSEFLQALGRLGVPTGAGIRAPFRVDTVTGDTIFLDPQAVRDSMFVADSIASLGMQVFGMRTFRRAGTQFDPALFGPVDRGYRVGPGDELILVLTGDVEAAYEIEITREGHLFIPNVGQIAVSGLTLAQLEDVLYSRLARVYSGISRAPDASTRFQITVGQLRTNQVFVRGEVVAPNAYQVSSVATVMTALYQAGGPTEDGSFRHVEVHRGGRVAHVVDLYEFLVGGSLAGDIRLEHNDHIFIPPARAHIRVEGAIRRPAIYELVPGEGLRELLLFSGGLRSDALVRRVQIDRIVPPEEQRPGLYRTLVDADIAALAAGGPAVPLYDGDVVTVFAVNDERRNRVIVEGEVRNPGLYEWSPGATLWSVLARADGITEHAYTSRAHVYRIVEADRSRRLIPVSLELDAAGGPLVDLPLLDNDSIVVFSREELRTTETVSIDGFVKFPDSYELARGMTLKDLILAAGGFIEGAFVIEAELSRVTNPLTRSDTTAVVLRVPLGLTAGGGVPGGSGSALIPDWEPRADDVELRHGDRVFVRRAPGFESPSAVRVTGQVMVPGTYVLTSRDERLTDVLARAGGLTPQAYTDGLHVVRQGRVISGDLSRALGNEQDRNNIVLIEGDSVHVPTFDPTVLVTGAVNFEARVLHVPGRGLDYYISQAGGFAEAAETDRITISYPNGERSEIRKSIFGIGSPDVQPGSEISVPAKPEDRIGINWDQVVTRGATLISMIATIALAIGQLRN